MITGEDCWGGFTPRRVNAHQTCTNVEYHSSTGNRSRLSGALLIFRQTASAERPKPGGKIRVTHHECTKQTRNDANVRSRVAKPKPSIELAKTVVTTVKYAQRGRVAEWQSSRVAVLDSSTRCRQKKRWSCGVWKSSVIHVAAWPVANLRASAGRCHCLTGSPSSGRLNLPEASSSGHLRPPTRPTPEWHPLGWPH